MTFDPLIGQLIDGRYKIGQLIGTGGMGKVYLAEHQTTKKSYAIKVIHSQFLTDEKALQRFGREARVLSAIDHPHIVELYDYGQTPDEIPYLAMEYLTGTTVRAYLDETATGLPLFQAVSIAMQAAQALHYVHERGIVHRDIKPDNIQLTLSEEKSIFAKLFDFGIARVQDQVGLTQVSATPPSTFAYGAPEIHLKSEYLSPAIDVYALGITLFEMITKQRPFIGTGLDVVWAHMQTAPRQLSECRQDVKIPSRLEKLIAQMLEKDPGQRPTMAQVAERLAALTTLLKAVSVHVLHSLRTYVIPSKQPEPASRDTATALPAPTVRPTDLQAIVATRVIDQVEIEREQLSAQLESECSSIIQRYLPPDPPTDIAELQRRCSELTAAKNGIDLTPLQEELAQEKASLRAIRNGLRQLLQGQRSEVRTLLMEGRPVPAELTEELQRTERAYAAPAPPSALAERVQQEGIRRQQLRAELIDAQRALTERLLSTLLAPPKPSKSARGGLPETVRKMLAGRLTEVLSQLDALNESLKTI